MRVSSPSEMATFLPLLEAKRAIFMKVIEARLEAKC